MSELEEIVRKLTVGDREALEDFVGQWVAGPTLGDGALSAIKALRDAELLERRFADEGPPVHSVGEYALTVKLSACWHFRLTPLGIQVRDYLRTKEGVL